MPALLNLLLRVALLVAGLVFATSLVIVLLLGVTAWALRAVVARLLGRPVTPFVVRVDPRQAFRRAGESREARRFPTSADVTDVEIKSNAAKP